MRRFLAAVAFFSILSTGASLAEGWFMKRVEVPVFCADIIEVRKLLLEMVPGVGLGIDPVRNLLLVHGTDEQIEIIQELLEVGKRTDSTLDITAVQTLGPVETETETETETVSETVSVPVPGPVGSSAFSRRRWAWARREIAQRLRSRLVDEPHQRHAARAHG